MQAPVQIQPAQGKTQQDQTQGQPRKSTVGSVPLYSKGMEKTEGDDAHVIIKVCEDRNLLDGVIGIIHYVRESICEMIFEIFIRSAN